MVIDIEDEGAVVFANLRVGQQVEVKYDVTSLNAPRIEVDDDGGEGEKDDEEDKEDEDISETDDENDFEIKVTTESISPDGNSIAVNGKTIIIQDAEIDRVVSVGAAVEARITALTMAHSSLRKSKWKMMMKATTRTTSMKTKTMRKTNSIVPRRGFVQLL